MKLTQISVPSGGIQTRNLLRSSRFASLIGHQIVQKFEVCFICTIFFIYSLGSSPIGRNKICVIFVYSKNIQIFSVISYDYDEYFLTIRNIRSRLLTIRSP